jgi:cell division ATPase FtsA
MSERNNIVAIVDIGTNTAICLIGCENADKRVEILGHSIVASAGVRRGVVFNIDEVVEVIKKAVSRASQNLEFEIKRLYVNITGKEIRTVKKAIKKIDRCGKDHYKVGYKNAIRCGSFVGSGTWRQSVPCNHPIVYR